MLMIKDEKRNNLYRVNHIGSTIIRRTCIYDTELSSSLVFE